MLKRLLTSLAIATALTLSAEDLVILHTNDTHSQIYPAGDGLGGVARRKVLIDSVRAERHNVMLLDAGDVVQGTLYFNLYKGEVEEKLMNALGYEMRILGNHEFDNGMQILADNLRRIDGAEFALLNYNVANTPLEMVNASPYVIKRYPSSSGIVSVGFIPVNLQPKGMISPQNCEGVEYLDPVDAVNSVAWWLKNKQDVDYIVAVSHIGYAEDTALVARTRDVDLVIGGHSHTKIDPADPASVPYLVKNADGRDIVVAQTGKSGRYLGEITIDLDNLSAVPAYRLIPVDSRLDDRLDPAIEAIIEPYTAAVDDLFKQYIGKASRDLPNDGPGLLNFAADFVMNRGKQLADNIDLSIVNKGGLRTTLKKGRVSKGDVITMMPFFNNVQVIEVTGDSLAAVFDVMARSNGNGVSANVDAVYDPAAGRCTEVTINGRPIDPQRIYRLATINYLADGGDYMHSLIDHKLVAQSPQILFEDLIDYLTVGDMRNKNINPSDKVRMRPKEK